MAETITYRVDLDDVKPYAKFATRNLPYYKNIFKKIGGLFFALGIVAGLLLALRNSLVSGISSAIFIWLFAVFFVWLMKNFSVPTASLKLFKATFPGWKDGVLYEVSASDGNLSFSSPGRQSQVAWNSGLLFFETETYLYIFVTVNQALMINKNKIISGSYDKFLVAVKSYLPNN
jgi:hypothetical protein